MEQWALQWWHEIVFVVSVVVIPAGAWAIRLGLASKGDLAAETERRGKALTALEEKIEGRLGGIERDQSELSDRTLRIETEIGHLPTSEDIADLKTAMGRTDTRIEGMLREIQSMARATARIEDHLLKGN